MKKIIGVLRPFSLKQQFYVYDGENKIAGALISNNEIPEELLQLTVEYGITEVNFSGSKPYIKGIVKKIQEAEMKKFNKNTIKFNF